MCTGMTRTKNVQHGSAAHDERIGHQRAVTAPWHGFRAHYCEWALHLTQFQQLAQALLECLSLHVIGEASKGGVQPACVGRVLSSATVPTKGRQVLVCKALRLDRMFQGYLVVLGVSP